MGIFEQGIQNIMAISIFTSYFHRVVLYCTEDNFLGALDLLPGPLLDLHEVDFHS